MGTDDKLILVVDDDAMNREVMEALLETEGYQVLTARNGKIALQIASDKHPNLILLDVRMPDISGYDVCKKLKSDATTADITIIIISGLDGPEERRRSKEAGADMFMPRPFGGETFLEEIRRIFTNAD